MKKTTRVTRGGAWAVGGSVLAAVVASACCWLPLVLIVIGGSVVGLAAFLEGLRPWFLGVAFVLLGLGFYLNYFRREKCVEGSTCVAPNRRLRRTSRIMLWVATAGVVAFALFPSYVGALLGTTSVAGAEAGQAGYVVLKVDGMSCAGCAVAIEQSLLKVPGVTSAFVDYEKGEALVEVDSRMTVASNMLIGAVEDAGYEATLADATALAGVPEGGAPDTPGMRVEMRVDGITSQQSADDVVRVLKELRGVIDVDFNREEGLAVIAMEPDYPVSMVLIIAALERAGYTVPMLPEADREATRVTGQWRGFLEHPDEKLEVTIDIARRPSGKLIGELDLPAQGIRNMPFDVHVVGREVVFDLPDMDLAGTLSEDGRGISGRLVSRQQELPLELTRVGEAEVSEAGLSYKALVLHALARDAGELKAQFNADVDKVRLIMLLAPS